MLVSRLDHSASTIQQAVTDRFIAIAPDSDLAVLSTHQNNWLQLQARRSPLQQLTAALKAQRDQGQPIQELHLIAHANSSGIQIGSTTLNTAALRSHAAALASWKIKTLVLWSCQLAQNKDFIALLEELTGAEVFASNDSINSHQLTTQSRQGNQRSFNELIDHKTLNNWQGSLSSSVFTQLGSDIDGEAADDYSGYSVSLSDDGTIVAIGAYLDDDNGTDSGHTRIFQYSSGSWTQLGSDIVGEAAGDESGNSVSLSDDGTIVAIGAWKNDGSGSAAGHTRIFQYSSGSNSWSQLGSDINGEAAGDYSGWSVSLSDDGTIVAIGALGNDGNGGFSGHTRLYQYSSGSWTQLGSDIDGEAARDESGVSVSLSDDGKTVAIGANLNDANGTNSGHTRVFSLPSSSGSSSGGSSSSSSALSSIFNKIINGRRYWTDNLESLTGQSNINYGLLGNNDYLEVIGGINNFANGNNGDDHIVLRGGHGRYLGGADNDKIVVLHSDLDSWVNGNNGVDVITGSAGGMTYRGGPGDDVFAVSAGDVWGDKDADTFQATAGAECAIIHDYTVGLDRIQGVAGGSFSLTDQGLLYSLGDDQMLLLKGITDASQVTVI